LSWQATSSNTSVPCEKLQRLFAFRNLPYIQYYIFVLVELVLHDALLKNPLLSCYFIIFSNVKATATARALCAYKNHLHFEHAR